jgi:hypothetical protein
LARTLNRFGNRDSTQCDKDFSKDKPAKAIDSIFGHLKPIFVSNKQNLFDP